MNAEQRKHVDQIQKRLKSHYYQSSMAQPIADVSVLISMLDASERENERLRQAVGDIVEYLSQGFEGKQFDSSWFYAKRLSQNERTKCLKRVYLIAENVLRPTGGGGERKEDG